ncbi:MAG: diacylglycerol kinase [Rickettsiales bacterium]|jgi:diacylglycerol kinase (ATP)|nr:diacylglycerol kinase [Rickettsiales bacterium]
MKKRTGIKRILFAFKYSFNGFIVTFRTQEAFRQDVLVFVVLFPVVFILNILVVQRLILISSLFGILIAELTNTAIEVCINRISGKRHTFSKVAKDIGSCIVLISFLYLITVWSIVLWENFLK